MRLLFGIVLGGALTIGAAYWRDTSLPTGGDGRAMAERPMVNWDVVRDRWDNLGNWTRGEWSRLTRS